MVYCTPFPFAGGCTQRDWGCVGRALPLSCAAKARRRVSAWTCTGPWPHAGLVLRWVAWLSGKYASSTIDISLASIAAIHKDARVASPTADPRVRDAVEGAARVGPHNVKAEAIVVTPEHVRQF